MDKLTIDAMLARQANMSYGKWKAMQDPVVAVKPMIPDGWKECVECGKPFKPHDVRQRYCEQFCQRRANIKKNRERAREYARRKRDYT